MNRQIKFTSSKFPPVPGEDEETNPGRFGKALAAWIREKLIAQGYAISEEPIPEDWGWMVMVQRKPSTLWVGCGNEDGSLKKWYIFVRAESGILQKLFKRADLLSAVTVLEQQLEKIITAEPECMDFIWQSV